MTQSRHGLRSYLCFVSALLLCAATVHAADFWTEYQGSATHVVLDMGFDEGQGTATRNAAGGKPGEIHNAQWVPARKSNADPIAFDDKTVKELADDPEPGARKQYTVEVWCKPENDDGGYLVLKKHAFGFPSFGGGGKVTAYLHTEAKKDWSKPIAAACEVGRWQHYVLVCDDLAVRAYVNGVERLNAVLPARPAQSPDPILLGTCAGWGKGKYQGELGLFRLYDKALSEREVAEAFASLKDGLGPVDSTVVAVQAPRTLRRTFLKDDQNYEKARHALSFDGESAYVAVPASTNLDPAESLTVGAWIKPERTLPKGIEEQGYIVSKNSANRHGYMMTTYYQNGLSALVVTDKGAYSAHAFNALRPGQWQHVGFSWNGRTLQVYVDGEPVGKPTMTEGKLKAHPGQLHIGKAADRNGQYYKGAIDDVRILTVACGAQRPEGVGRPVVKPAFNSDPGGVVETPIAEMAGRQPERKPLEDFENLTAGR